MDTNGENTNGHELTRMDVAGTSVGWAFGANYLVRLLARSIRISTVVLFVFIGVHSWLNSIVRA
jgi:hypothetical protein